jgi:T4 RnlA family RNA ligase
MINKETIKREIANGYISEQQHPTAPLRILNYTQKTQFDWHWNNETKQCRGLIVDNNWNIVARPFQKFFSYEQLNGVVPNEPFTAYEKMDGSLGILYHVDGVPYIATRGSFTSPQAERATEIYRRKYRKVKVDQSMTYLFEIIYPENQIVVNYGNTEDLILLAVIETETGDELPLPNIGFTVVKQYDITEFKQLLEQQNDDREGFVVRFQSGQRVKIKFDEYKRLHKIITSLNPKHIWETLRSGKTLDNLLERTPDKFQQWVRETENELMKQFAEVECEARRKLQFGNDRKKLAQIFKQCQFHGIMFAILDRKNYKQLIWKTIKPKTNTTTQNTYLEK